MDVTAALFTVAVTVGSLAPAGAVETTVAPVSVPTTVVSVPAGGAGATASPVDQLPSLRNVSLMPSASKRPSALMPLYTSFAVLQGFDIYSTSKSISRGAQEANPLMKPVGGRNMASTVVKAAATAGSIYFIERAWKSNRKGAVIIMTALNVATAAVVAHNTQVAKR